MDRLRARVDEGCGVGCLGRREAGCRVDRPLLFLRGDGSGFLGNQPSAHREADQAGDVEDIEPLHQLHPVVFDRLGA